MELFEFRQKLLPPFLKQFRKFDCFSVRQAGLRVVGEYIGKQLVEVINEVFQRAIGTAFELILRHHKDKYM